MVIPKLKIPMNQKHTSEKTSMDLVLAFIIFIICLLIAFYSDQLLPVDLVTK
jgi:hypothetical protein